MVNILIKHFKITLPTAESRDRKKKSLWYVLERNDVPNVHFRISLKRLSESYIYLMCGFT